FSTAGAPPATSASRGASEPADESGRIASRVADRAASPPGAPGLRGDDSTYRVPGTSLRLPRREIAAAEIGDVIDAIDTSGEGIAVVRVTVIDRDAGLGAARLLLAPH